jgi:hypothetical protein
MKSQDNVSKAFAKSILRKTEGILFLERQCVNIFYMVDETIKDKTHIWVLQMEHKHGTNNY